MGDAAKSISARLPELLDFLQSTDVLELEIQEGDLRLRIRRSGNGFEAGEPVAATADVQEEIQPVPSAATITAPLVGTFYRSAAPDSPPFVSEGSRVEDETVVGIIESLNVLTEVEAGCRGVIADVRVAEGQAVEFGQSLFEVETNE